MGNGGAMRAGPIGAYFAWDLEVAADQARLAAAVTHANIEGQAGAMAVAAAAAWAAGGAKDPRDLFGAVLDVVPVGITRDTIERASSIGPDVEVLDVVGQIGNGIQALAQDTVPFALWCVPASSARLRVGALAGGRRPGRLRHAVRHRGQHRGPGPGRGRGPGGVAGASRAPHRLHPPRGAARRTLTSLTRGPYAPAMKITTVRATWLRAPIPAEHAHVSDFGRNDTFNMCLVEIETDAGLVGLGEAKAAVGNLGNYAAMSPSSARRWGPPSSAAIRATSPASGSCSTAARAPATRPARGGPFPPSAGAASR